MSVRDEAFWAASSFREKSNAIRDDLESWEPIIIPYLVARGIIPDASVYAYWKELRIGDVPSTAAARDSIPGKTP